jgi:hypothetical protein
MSSLSRSDIRRLILNEIEKMEEETLLRRHKDPGREMYTRSKMLKCGECGYKMSEEMCEDEMCEQCGGSMYEIEETLNEGDCDPCDDKYRTGDYEVINYDSDYNFVPDHMEDINYMHPKYGRRRVSDISLLDPDSAFGVGFEAGVSGEFDDEDIMEPGEAFGVGYKIGVHDSDVKIGNHKHYKGSYMAKNQMYKVAKYAEKLYHMIPDGHNLEDWMRTKLAQIADDIGEVYHALDHDIYEGDV